MKPATKLLLAEAHKLLETIQLSEPCNPDHLNLAKTCARMLISITINNPETPASWKAIAPFRLLANILGFQPRQVNPLLNPETCQLPSARVILSLANLLPVYAPALTEPYKCRWCLLPLKLEVLEANPQQLHCPGCKTMAANLRRNLNCLRSNNQTRLNELPEPWPNNITLYHYAVLLNHLQILLDRPLTWTHLPPSSLSQELLPLLEQIHFQEQETGNYTATWKDWPSSIQNDFALGTILEPEDWQ